jgi:hypothetical protein
VAALIRKQNADGMIGHNGPHQAGDGSGYNHAIAGLALAEAAGMASIQSTKDAAQKAIDYSINKHTHKAGAGGYSAWRYEAGMAPDTSVTGWFVMQCKSAKVASLQVDGAWTQGARAYLDTVTAGTGGGGGFGSRPGGVAYQPPKKDAPLSTTVCMTAVGMLCRQFMGIKPEDPVLVAGAKWLKEEPPRWIRSSDVDLYYWYYGTLVMFQMGPDYFDSWNEEMKKSLVGHIVQEGTYAQNKGSWDPQCKWSSSGGRAYMTAMGALCLEVYYRYLPMYR